MATTAQPVETPQPRPRVTGYSCELAGCTSWNASPRSACGIYYVCPPCWEQVERLTVIYQADDATNGSAQ